ncbi:phage associated protein, partial [Neisseria meningitidis]
MTRFQVAVFKLLFRVAVFYGNDKVLDCENLSAPPSFPRKWESRNEKQQEFIVND